MTNEWWHKYYKVCKDTDPEEVTELTEEFAAFGLIYVGYVCARCKYADRLDDLLEASLCQDSNGDVDIYVFRGARVRPVWELLD